MHCPIATQRITQDEFKQIAGEVMQHVFTIHNAFGRFFDEQIYTKELVDRMDSRGWAQPHTLARASCKSTRLSLITAGRRTSALTTRAAIDSAAMITGRKRKRSRFKGPPFDRNASITNALILPSGLSAPR
jgi:hypothetical protein